MRRLKMNVWSQRIMLAYILVTEWRQIMKKITFGEPEKLIPSVFCKNFTFIESEIKYPIEKIHFKENARGCIITMPLAKDEQIYGAGLQLQMFNLRGHKVVTRVNADPIAPTGDSHAPVPFFVSTMGYGVYLDTARYAEFHFGDSIPLKLSAVKDGKSNSVGVSTEELYGNVNDEVSEIAIQIPSARGIDMYIIEGDTITDIVAQYNMLSGGGCTVPKWALFPIYRCYTRYTEEQVLNSAEKLKNNGFKIGTIGLEPGWQSHSYSCSYVWDSGRYPHPQETIDKLRAMGYCINLWEHAFTNPASPIYESLLPYCGDRLVWNGLIPDFATSEAQRIFADYHKKIVDMGIDGFKLDECDSSDYKNNWSFPNLTEFPSGLDGEQYHSLFGVLYMQTMMEAMDNKPTLSEVRNAGALSASYPFVLYSDLYDHKDFLRGCATAGFSGLLWTPEVRDAKTKEEFLRRLQANVFSVQCLINAWYCQDFPWNELDCENEAKQLLEIREQLVPMLLKAFDKYSETGIPPVRALVSDYTNDANTYNIDDEYIFCDELIVAPIAVGETERSVYLPKGEWVDYFTKEPVSSGHFTVKTDFIPVYELRRN